MLKILLSLFLLGIFEVAGVSAALLATGTGAVQGSVVKFFTMLLMVMPLIAGIMILVAYKYQWAHVYAWLILPLVYGLLWFMFVMLK